MTLWITLTMWSQFLPKTTSNCHMNIIYFISETYTPSSLILSCTPTDSHLSETNLTTTCHPSLPIQRQISLFSHFSNTLLATYFQTKSSRFCRIWLNDYICWFSTSLDWSTCYINLCMSVRYRLMYNGKNNSIQIATLVSTFFTGVRMEKQRRAHV